MKMAEVEPLTLQVWIDALALALLYAYAFIGVVYFVAKIRERIKTFSKRASKKPEKKETKVNE